MVFSCRVCNLSNVRINTPNIPAGTPLDVQRQMVIGPVAMAHRTRSRECTNPDFSIVLPPVPDDPMALDWSYGLTTVPSRINTTLPITLDSLKRAGFPTPHLFVDDWDGGSTICNHLGLPTTYHQGTLQPFGNWILALWEIYLRNPTADRYAMFQDDFVTVRNLRQYLERVPYPERGYLNLYTAFGRHNRCGGNERVIEGKGMGWYEGALVNPVELNPDRLQAGLGAVALVFNNEAVRLLLSAKPIVEKPKAADRVIRYRKVDGGVVNAMNLAGWREYVHNPSLVQHIGKDSSCGNREHPQALTFPGTDFDCLSLLKERAP